ncbi:MAG: hypothetical protein KDB68_11010 [Planctomycetes bacterium]|nr:hypothetical protein [Planctomycetota bacterium]
MNQNKRFVVGQHVFSLELKRAGQLLGMSIRDGTCIVRFTDSGEVQEIQDSELRVASWEEIRKSGKSTRLPAQNG